jgi:2-dehydro-3-deoxyphosphogluconate aldolase/(4S)-4-hydroxy-2-oxoglutarate aldolase
VPCIPGVSTATEIQRAVEHGIDVVKFFPAEAAGGVDAVKALSAPFPDVRFVPTGGITERTLPGYLAVSSVLAVGGSWMVASPLLVAGDFARVAQLCREAVALVAGARKAAAG